MTTNPRKLALVAVCLAAMATVVVFRNLVGQVSPVVDLKPSACWIFDSAHVQNGKVTDVTGNLNGTITGKANLKTDGPTPRLELAQLADGVTIKAKITPDAEFLPKDAMSLVAWVRVDVPQDWGAIIGCFQDNGPREKGFVLGFNKTSFYFGLASVGGDDGDGKITYLTGKTNYVPGQWYHVAATYDGKAMRLFVNGTEDAISTEQSGRILYAEKATFVIGRYKDDDEDFGMTGALKEVMLVPRAVTPALIFAHYKADEGLAQVRAQAKAPFVISPYLQYATRTSIVVMCETTAPTRCTVSIGDRVPFNKEFASKGEETIHEIALTNLEPKTRYIYKVTCTAADGTVTESGILTFMTAVDPTDAWSFAVIGDTQANPKMTGKVAKSMWERRPHFALHTGDVVDNGPVKREWTDELFTPCQDLFSRVAVFPTIGNHERNHAHYYKYFSLPKPEYYYQYRYGNADFFSIDTNKPVGPGTEQYLWLDKALAASDATWKICYHHHPAYSSDSDDYGNTFQLSKTAEGDRNARQLVTLYEKHHVDVCFNGHIHLYERTWPIRAGKVDRKSGVVYITSGGGGGKLEDIGPTPTFFKAQNRSDFHYCYVTVHGGVFELKAFDSEGRLFDQVMLQKNKD